MKKWSKFDNDYCKNHKLMLYSKKLLCKRIWKLQKFWRIMLLIWTFLHILRLAIEKSLIMNSQIWDIKQIDEFIFAYSYSHSQASRSKCLYMSLVCCKNHKKQRFDWKKHTFVSIKQEVDIFFSVGRVHSLPDRGQG